MSISESETIGNKWEDGKHITNQNEHKLFYKYWSKEITAPRGLVFVTHGAAEHCLNYEEIAENLTEQGFFVFSHDHQGHGQSGGDRVHIEDIRHYTRDIFQHTDMVRSQFPDVPIFIFGHSLGGTISILAALDQPDYFQGVVLIGPVVTPDQDSVGAVRICFAKMLACIYPQCPILWLKSDDISRDPEICKKYDEDPLNYHGGLKAKFGLSLLLALQEIESKLETIKWPFLVVHGVEDKIVSPRSSQALYDRAESQDKTIKLYEGCFHQIHNELEPDKTDAMNLICNWLTDRAPEKTSI